MPALPNQKGGASLPPMPRPIPTPSMEGIGKPPPDNEDTSGGIGVREKDARTHWLFSEMSNAYYIRTPVLGVFERKRGEHVTALLAGGI